MGELTEASIRKKDKPFSNDGETLPLMPGASNLRGHVCALMLAARIPPRADSTQVAGVRLKFFGESGFAETAKLSHQKDQFLPRQFPASVLLAGCRSGIRMQKGQGSERNTFCSMR